MAIVKVFDVNGVKEIKCFDTLVDVPYLEDVEEDTDVSETMDNPFA